MIPHLKKTASLGLFRHDCVQDFYFGSLLAGRALEVEKLEDRTPRRQGQGRRRGSNPSWCQLILMTPIRRVVCLNPDELAPRRVGAPPPPLPLPLPSRGYVFQIFNLKSPARQRRAKIKILDTIMTEEAQARRLREVWLSYGGGLF